MTPLMSPLSSEAVDRVGVCRRGGPERCAEISFELLQPAYLLVFSTRDDAVDLPACDGRLERDDPGQRRFRLRVRNRNVATHQPGAGFYALAVADADVAAHLQHLLRRAPGGCGADADTVTDASADAWIGQLQTALARYGDRVQWQAIHLDAEVRPL